MQKLESSLKNMVLVLVGVALVVGAVLAYVNHITSGPIAQKAEQSLAAGIKSVMGTDDLQVAAPKEVPQTIDGKEVTFIVHACSDKSGISLGAAVESPSSALRDSRSWCQGQHLVPERRQGQHHWQDTKGWQPAREQGRQEWQCC